MQSTAPTELTDEQFDQLEDFLDSIEGAMDLEEIDGFFCALISGPSVVMPSEYLPYVFGENLPDIGLGTQVSEMVGLLFRQWNHIADTLLRDEVYFPLLFEYDAGKCKGNDWADGYMLGVSLRADHWADLIEDEENAGLMAPVMALHFERHEDPEMRPEPILDDRREDIIAHMIAAILGVYRYFAPQRRLEVR